MIRLDARMTRRAFAQASAAIPAGVAAGALAGRTVLAQDATPVAGAASGVPEGALVVADGLTGPRFLAISEAGVLYVTETGTGGDEPVAPPEFGTGELATPGATPVSGETQQQAPPTTRGYTGRISQVTSDGTQSVLASGLASYSVGLGPVGIALGDTELYFSIGGAALPAGTASLPEENTVNGVDLETGAVREIANLAIFARDNNLYGDNTYPNLYEIAMGGDGRLLVNDAGGNTIYSVDPATGQVTLVTVIPPLGQLPGGAAFTGDDAARPPVPTALSLGDGISFIGLLSESWPQGAPSVLTLAPGGVLSAVASGLTMLVGLSTGPDGQVYGSQLLGPPDASGTPGPGSVVRIYGDGTVVPVIENLPTPHGTAFDVAGNIYVAINSVPLGPDAPAGQVVRIDGIAAVG